MTMQRFWKCECGESHRSNEEKCPDCEQLKEAGEEITDDIEERQAVLADFLDVDFSDVDDGYDNNFGACGHDYKVLTDDEADEEVKKSILSRLYSFRPQFIASELRKFELEEMIAMYIRAKGEDANDAIRALIDDEDAFCQAAVSADGRGHFLASYDGDEWEHEGYYIYKS
jgi:hypothetical protein